MDEKQLHLLTCTQNHKGKEYKPQAKKVLVAGMTPPTSLLPLGLPYQTQSPNDTHQFFLLVAMVVATTIIPPRQPWVRMMKTS